ncbi:hypothetical protein AXI64_gp217 [Vibrio phage qdvp001]|uniref:hypothetical protein n=1 Tax=Vibrio phage qdvp001 TaxID=1003177 RepID=UPI0007230332|nr:hypothetical protein AXI64_gp217 [Vibrio phage qdvp001]ALM62209.1 hypothetical protein qdvp001_217 [Vibrio phage qdvp001]
MVSYFEKLTIKHESLLSGEGYTVEITPDSSRIFNEVIDIELTFSDQRINTKLSCEETVERIPILLGILETYANMYVTYGKEERERQFKDRLMASLEGIRQ